MLHSLHLQHAFPWETHGLEHRKRIEKHVRMMASVYSCAFSCGNILSNDLYTILKTYVFTLKNRVFNIVSQWRLREHTLFTIEYTCKTERKHGYEHGT
jgi:hypothetical protein